MDGKSPILICSQLIYMIAVFSQKDYVCFDFVPRHHNIIRYRRGVPMIKDDFSTVCAWVRFINEETWKYDLFLGKHTLHSVINQ